MTAPESIRKLVETFEQNISEYRSSKNETELRREFLDKFFTTLGWDVDNLQGMSESEKEVAHEFSVEIDGQQKKADYAFRASKENKGKFNFLVEAKKPSVKVDSNLDAAFQIRRYGWSAKIPINILTDFEHFAVYDCRVKPKYGEKASLNRIMLLHYKEYIERWDEIAEIFSPKAIRKGALNKYVETIKGKRGTADVDDDFLQEIERWRELLAKSIASNNDWIDISGLNYAVQMIIDRIVFLRICEERSIEPENQLQDIANKENVYKELFTLFKRADTKYNSGLFHFKKESGEASRADDLTPRLIVDDKTLKDIILNLYYPKSPYAFLYIPSDILGQVYERFLGKVIRLTEGHRAKVEEKPEVKKAGGVFYTPTFIVDYIVMNTVGKLVNWESGNGKLEVGKLGIGRLGIGMTPKEVAKLKIVDPACGSGTFLLGAFQYLLDWHLKWYTENDPEKWASGKSPAIYQSVTYQRQAETKEDDAGRRVIRDSVVDVKGEWRLTTAKKKEILLNNIYGVDIDSQAVEVTNLSLLLKVLEDLNGQLTLGMDRLLPDLGNNIKWGNSLIGEDYFEGRLFNTISNEEHFRVNAFDWKEAFPEVFEQGGFDAVVGNPPYVRVRIFKELYPKDAEYLESKYQCATHVWDIYLLFFEKAVELLKQNGLVSFIIPIQTLHQPNCESLRNLILSKTSIISIADLSQLRVFQEAIVKNCILVVKKSLHDDNKVEIYYPSNGKELFENPIRVWPQSLIYQNPSYSMKIDLMSPKKLLCEKLESKSWRLKELCYVTFGLRSSAKGVGQGGKERLITNNKSALKAKPYLEGRDIKRFATYPTGRFIKYIPSEMYSSRSPELFETPKIVSQSMLSKKRLISTIDLDNYYVEQSLVCIIPHGILTEPIENNSIPLEFILGILNSKLESFYFGTSIIDHSLGGGLIHATPGSQSNLLVPKASQEKIDTMVSLVEKMSDLHKRLAPAQDPRDKEGLEKRIESTDKAIDKLVYELYGLTEDEIGIVEGNIKT